MKSVVSIDEFRTNLAELVGRVMYGKGRVVIKKYNREAAVLLSVDEYQKLVDPAKKFSKKIWESKFALIDRIKERISERDQDVLEAEIASAVKEVRATKRNGA